MKQLPTHPRRKGYVEHAGVFMDARRRCELQLEKRADPLQWPSDTDVSRVLIDR